MTLNADTIWEIRTTGAQTNGGGFYNRVPGTSVDYSQQDSAQLSLSNIATDGAGTGLSSVTGGFTAAMQGNVIYLTGGTAIPGWYEIVSYISGTSVTIDRSAGLNKTGVTGNVGGAFKIGGTLDNDFFAINQKAAGNKIWVKSGTYTLGEIITIAVPGAITALITMEGYNSFRGDSPIEGNRPIIDCGSSYYMSKGGAGNWEFLNLIFTGSAADVFLQPSGGGGNIYYNCKFVNTSAVASRDAFDIFDGYNTCVSCEFSSTNGNAIKTATSGSKFINCYVHDSNKGFSCISGGVSNIVGCAISSCITGIDLGTNNQFIVLGNVIYNCGTGLLGTTSQYNICINNIISECEIGVSWGTEYKTSFWDFNCWNNTVDVSNVTKGPNDITADPKLKDPANEDFTLDTGSPCFGAGLQLGEIVGL